jgi:hypothetical protein
VKHDGTPSTAPLPTCFSLRFRQQRQLSARQINAPHNDATVLFGSCDVELHIRHPSLPQLCSKYPSCPHVFPLSPPAISVCSQRLPCDGSFSLVFCSCLRSLLLLSPSQNVMSPLRFRFQSTMSRYPATSCGEALASQSVLHRNPCLLQSMRKTPLNRTTSPSV